MLGRRLMLTHVFSVHSFMTSGNILDRSLQVTAPSQGDMQGPIYRELGCLRNCVAGWQTTSQLEEPDVSSQLVHQAL